MRHRLTTRWQHLDALARLRLGIIVALLVVGLLAALLGAQLSVGGGDVTNSPGCAILDGT
jgi:hypothetical protein